VTFFDASFHLHFFTPMPDPDFQADLARYPKRPFLKEQSIWAIWVYRYGRRTDRRPGGVARSFHIKIYWLLHRAVETLTGVSLP
jgi:serine O-acetyltransferase